ncbi:type VI secretion system Vgr family protein [Janthinobacterium sp. BJB401]|uniref:type VI secretion system Vgr family protein n=1 Tax=Janthinobacterium sp. BJB401 TaxID=2745934 RepID=UPI0015955E41|nr:type VI secretion system Vgr family protein [Janthinobacterium sp. BJB401]NVI83519.1 type VI secretion system tip protein VgrG [Janthinobacterium sp. BJB401]
MLASPLTDFTQATRLLQLTTPLGENRLLAECVRGEEGLSQGFAFQIAALSTDAAISLRTLIGQPALLQLLTATSTDDWRPFHGHITAVELVGANGGLARYHLTVEPWTAFLAHGRDSRVFQDMTVCDILDALFATYEGQGRLAPAWRFDIAERAVYPQRSLTTQYQESDLAFAERLMLEEGLFYYFEHMGDASSPSLGGHTLVIADHNGAFPPNAQPAVNFTQPGAVMKVDSIDRWRTEWRQQTNAIEIGSWDYRSRDQRPVAVHGDFSGATLLSRDVPGAYAYASREQGQRIAVRQLQALQACKEIHVGAGTVRTLSPGTTFTLHGHALFDAASDDERHFLIVRTVHLMHNNLSADLQASIRQRISTGLLAMAISKEQDSGLLQGAGIAERPLYRNRVDAIRSSTPYRATGADQHGRLLHPRPTVAGQQTAIVVGPPGAVIHTDRDHRIKVQFHWQRGTLSHSRLPHPHADSHTGAPGDDGAGTWVRVATTMATMAGANWGANAVPRVGQEVLIDFLEGNIDRPVVIGTVYNGQGQSDAQQNQVTHGAGAATGNSPAWFPGAAAGHAHPAALSGIKSQTMSHSGLGSGAYSQLVFDDSPGQSRLSLQRHAAAHEGTAELNLGHLRHQTDNQRLAPAGFGAELKTEHGAALRAGQGLLLSTHQRSGGSVMDASEAVAQIEHSLALQTTLAQTAQKHNAGLKDEQGQAEAAPDTLPALRQMRHSIDTLKAGDGSGAAQVIAYSAPLLQLSSPAGIAATTPAHAIFAAGNTISIVAGHDINFGAQGNLFHAVQSGISLFTYGKVSKADKPNQETGIKLHAASGKVSSQSQSDETRLTADKAVTVASTSKGINIAAKQHVLMTVQGAYIKLEGGNIEIHGPGKMEFKASMKELTGPARSTAKLPYLPKAGQAKNFLELNYRWDDLQPMVGAPYTLLFANGVTMEGKLDAHGFARLDDIPNSGAVVLYGEDERDAEPRKKQKTNQVIGAKPRSDEEAQAVLEKYLAQEDAYYNDNYFPDELAEMSAERTPGAGSRTLEYDFHYDDYRYADEETPEDRETEKNYRERHDNGEGQA